VMKDKLLMFVHTFWMVKGGDDDKNDADCAKDFGITVVFHKDGKQYGGNKPSIEETECGIEVLQDARGNDKDSAKQEYVL
jgi:hypothetical protein